MELSSQQPTDLLRRCIELEINLKSFRDHSESRKGHEEEIRPILSELQRTYETIIINHTSFSRSKDAMAQLWKHCFYYHIEEYRRSMKHIVGAIDAQDADGPQLQKLQEKLVSVTNSFKSFLGKTTTFFTDLLGALERRIDGVKSGGPPLGSTEVDDLLYLSHRCLIYLGDTSRYQEMHLDGKNKNWQISQRYYSRALRYAPHSGHAHNQLAVVAVYAESDCTALYHYCRSIMIKDTFQTGLANLALFFKKNAKSVRELQVDDQISDVHNSSIREKETSARSATKKFNTAFIRLHGILFHVTSPDQISSHDANDMLREFNNLTQEVLDSLTGMIVHSLIGEGMLLRLIVICIFSVHRCVFEASEGLGHDRAMVKDIRTLSGSYSLMLLFSFINRYLCQLFSFFIV